MKHHPRFHFLLVLLGALLVLLAPMSASAQPKEPLRMAVLNVSSKGGAQPTAQIVEILKTNNSISIIDADVVRAGMDDFAVNEKILRKGDLREKFHNRISRMLQAKNIEGLLIVDVFSKGRKLQVVVIGPEGVELKDIKRSIRSGRIDQDQGVDILKSVFPALGPTVLAYRAERAALDAGSDPDPGPEPGPDKDPTRDPERDPSRDPERDPDIVIPVEKPEPKAAPGTFVQDIDVAVGLFAGQRSMEVKESLTDPPDAIRHNTPLVGVGIAVDAIALPVGEQGEGAVAVTGFFNYAPFKTEFKSENPDGTTTSDESKSSFLRLGGQVHYRRFFTPSTIGGLYGGGEYITLRIETKQNYTGNIYGMARAGAELGISFAPESFIFLHGGVLPVLKADNSAGALGDSPTSMGFEAGALVHFRLTDQIFARLNYSFQRIKPEYPEPQGTSKINEAATSTDQFHNGGLMIGVSL